MADWIRATSVLNDTLYDEARRLYFTAYTLPDYDGVLAVCSIKRTEEWDGEPIRYQWVAHFKNETEAIRFAVQTLDAEREAFAKTEVASVSHDS